MMTKMFIDYLLTELVISCCKFGDEILKIFHLVLHTALHNVLFCAFYFKVMEIFSVLLQIVPYFNISLNPSYRIFIELQWFLLQVSLF